MINFLYLFLYALAFILLGFFCEWIYRKVLARVQLRHGPLVGKIGLLQPFADFVKLLFKDDISRENTVFRWGSILLVAISLFVLFLVPFHSVFLGFPGDFLFIIGLFDLYVGIIFLLGVYSANEFGLISSMRKALMFFSYEGPFILAVLSFMIYSNTLSLSGLQGFSPILIIPAGVYFVSSMAKLGKLPFDVSVAEQELVSGYSTDMSGRKLALLQLSENLEFLFVGALGAALLFGPSPFNVVQAVPIVILLSFFAALFPRYRVDQATKLFLTAVLPVAILGVFLCYL